MNISFMNLKIPADYITIDYAWASFKTYHEENYKGKTKWNWNIPFIDDEYDNIDDIIQEIISQKPDVLGISLYVWNVGISLKIAERVKQNLPNCIIVVGGPHILYKEQMDYFKKNWFIDFVCEPNGYGEPFFDELLYQIETDKNLFGLM